MTTLKSSVGILIATILLTGNVMAQTRENNAKSFLWKQCNEDAIFVHVDPVSLQNLVPSGYTMLLIEGQARVLLLAQNCPHYRFDGGDEIGATQEVHMWLAIEGPKDVRPIVGAEHTLPTMTWFTLFTGSSNPLDCKNWTESGTASVPIDGLFLDPPGPTRGGRVLLSPDQSYSWQVETKAPFARLIGVNHDVYGKDSGGKIVLNRIQALLTVTALDSPGTLKVVGGIGPGKCIGPGTYEVVAHHFYPMWARASLGAPAPK